MSKANDRRITELTIAVTQQGLTVPAGYVFDPRRTPPLYPRNLPTVARELPKDISPETTELCDRCDLVCTGACDPASEDLEGSAP